MVYNYKNYVIDILIAILVITDYYGRWKMAQYTIKDSFAPVIITGTISGNTLRVYVVSDLRKIKYDVNARIQVYTWTSFKPLHETSIEVTLVRYIR